MHKVREQYARVEGTVLFDVGWESDVAACRAALSEAVFSLRLSPVRVARLTPAEVTADVEAVLRAAGPLDRAALCCINLVSRPRGSMDNSGRSGPPLSRLGPRREPASLAPAPPPLRGASRRGRRRGAGGEALQTTASRSRLARRPGGLGTVRSGLNSVVNFGDRTLDGQTPDDCVRAIFETAGRYRRYGA